MQIPAGPNQIAQTYMGNPAALQADIQKDQQKNPNISPDFAKLLALGTITSQKDNAAKAQALQQLAQLQAQGQGKPPTVMQQLQQKAAQMAAQRAAMEHQHGGLPSALPGNMEDEEGGGGIDQLPSNIQMAGGGIVAFSGEDNKQEVNDAAEKRKKQLEEDHGGWMGKLGAAAYDIGTLPFRGLAGAVDSAFIRPLRAMTNTSIPYLGQLIDTSTPTPAYDAYLKEQAAKNQQPAPAPTPTPTPVADAQPTTERVNVNDLINRDRQNVQNTPARTPTPPATQTTKPVVQQKQKVQPAPPAAQATPEVPFDTFMENTVRKQVAQDPEAEYNKAIARNQKAVGLEDLLKPQEKRVADLRALYERQKAERPAGWIDWAQGVATADPRKGLGYALGAGGANVNKVKAAEQAEERAMAEKLFGLDNEITKARIEGRYKDAAAAEAARKAILDTIEKATTSGASLVSSKRQEHASLVSSANQLAGSLAHANAINNNTGFMKFQTLISNAERELGDARQDKINLRNNKQFAQDEMKISTIEQSMQKDNKSFDQLSPVIQKQYQDAQKRINEQMGIADQKIQAAQQRLKTLMATMPASGGTTTPPPAGGGGVSPKDRAAAEAWLKANPNDPRAPQVRARLNAG